MTSPRLLLALSALALVPAAPAAAAEVSVNDKSFGPTDVTIAPGESVTWRWASGTHNVHVKTGPEAFDSGFKDTGETFTRAFTTAGTYSYICDAHPSMRGAVTVTGGTPTPATAPAAGTVDQAPPRLATVRVSSLAVVGFTASGAATVHVRIVHARRTVRRATMRVVAGRNRLPLRVRGLRKGRYSLFLQAADAAGRRSATVTRTLLVTRAALARRPVAPLEELSTAPALAPAPAPPPPPPAVSDESGQDSPGDADGDSGSSGGDRPRAE